MDNRQRIAELLVRQELRKTRNPVILERPRCDQLFFVYQGLGHKLMVDPLVFARETGLVRRNVVMFSDPRHAYYHGGISAEVSNLPDMLLLHEEIDNGMAHAHRTFAVGTSAGGYAALLFGYYLCVEEVIAFAPTTRLSRNDIDERSMFHQLLEIPAAHHNLAELLGDGNGRTRYRIYYNESETKDRLGAEALADCEGVQLYPQRGEGHDVVNEMIARGSLGSVLPPVP